MRHGHRFSHISETNFAFITNFKNMTYDYYLKQLKSMPEWKVFENLARNTGLVSEIERTICHQLTHAYGPIQKEDEKF